MTSHLEKRFALVWRAINAPKLDAEVKFHPSRKWRFDFAHAESKIAVEIEGGAWSGGRHTRGAGFVKDAEKYLAAQFLGWTVFRLTPELITADNCERIAERMR